MVAKSHARIAEREKESRSICRLIEMHKFGDLRPKTEEKIVIRLLTPNTKEDIGRQGALLMPAHTFLTYEGRSTSQQKVSLLISFAGLFVLQLLTLSWSGSNITIISKLDFFWWYRRTLLSYGKTNESNSLIARPVIMGFLPTLPEKCFIGKK